MRKSAVDVHDTTFEQRRAKNDDLKLKLLGQFMHNRRRLGQDSVGSILDSKLSSSKDLISSKDLSASKEIRAGLGADMRSSKPRLGSG